MQTGTKPLSLVFSPSLRSAMLKAGGRGRSHLVVYVHWKTLAVLVVVAAVVVAG